MHTQITDKCMFVKNVIIKEGMTNIFMNSFRIIMYFSLLIIGIITWGTLLASKGMM